ncbi:hypothetical protein GLOIN_2v1522964, partial [Rhizophagus irregularis DAOM 181602=DAOM 197198]
NPTFELIQRSSSSNVRVNQTFELIQRSSRVYPTFELIQRSSSSNVRANPTYVPTEKLIFDNSSPPKFPVLCKPK